MRAHWHRSSDMLSKIPLKSSTKARVPSQNSTLNKKPIRAHLLGADYDKGLYVKRSLMRSASSLSRKWNLKIRNHQNYTTAASPASTPPSHNPVPTRRDSSTPPATSIWPATTSSSRSRNYKICRPIRQAQTLQICRIQANNSTRFLSKMKRSYSKIPFKLPIRSSKTPIYSLIPCACTPWTAPFQLIRRILWCSKRYTELN